MRRIAGVSWKEGLVKAQAPVIHLASAQRRRCQRAWQGNASRQPCTCGGRNTWCSMRTAKSVEEALQKGLLHAPHVLARACMVAQETEPMGTAGPLKLAEEILADGSGDPFFVLNR